MVEILLRIIDSPLQGDAIFDSKASRRGDVIVAMPDNWSWTTKELTHSFWRIVALPNIPLSWGEMLTAPEPITDPNAPNRTLQFRMYRFITHRPINSYPPSMRTWLNDNTRATPRLVMTSIKLSGQTSGSDIEFESLYEIKAPIPDPG